MEQMLKDWDWAGEQQERAYWDAFNTLKLLYGPKVPDDFDEFVSWIDDKVEGYNGHL